MFCGSPLLISRLKMWCLSSYANEWNIWTFSISSVWSSIPRAGLKIKAFIIETLSNYGKIYSRHSKISLNFRILKNFLGHLNNQKWPHQVEFGWTILDEHPQLPVHSAKYQIASKFDDSSILGLTSCKIISWWCNFWD